MPVTIIGEGPAGPETVRAAVLFADLRGYTTLAERLSPLAVVGLLDEYFSVLGTAIADRGGTVFHSAGDSLMAGFGLSSLATASVGHAVDAGRRIVAAFAPVSERWYRRVGITTGVGVGVHVGELALAELGPEPLRRRTLIGDTVNVAARLCQRARAGEVLLSASVTDELDRSAVGDVIPLPDYTLRGRGEPVRIFCVPARDRIVVERTAAEGPGAGPVAIS